MATIDSADIIADIIARDGDAEPGDPRDAYVVKIVEYTNFEGRRTWGVVFAREVGLGMADRYEEVTEYVRDPVVIWRRA